MPTVERQEYSVFNKYSRGESSMRLYIKNLGKHVEENVGLYNFMTCFDNFVYCGTVVLLCPSL